MVDRLSLLTLGGLDLVLDRNQETGGRAWAVTNGPSTPEDLEPFIEEVSFGAWGFGSSLTAIRDQHDEGIGIDTEEWGEAAPGYEQNKLVMALDDPVVAMATALQTVSTTTGPNSPDTGANDTGIGTVDWGSPGNIIASDNTRAAIVALNSGSTSRYLTGTDYDFALPANALITGITVEVEGFSTVVHAALVANCRIIKGGVIDTTVTRASALPGTTSAQEAYITFGGPNDLWGLDWTAADINATNFGAAFWLVNNSGSTAAPEVDHMRITVTTATNGTVKFLYVGAGPVLKKINLTTLAVVDTKTFSHGTNTAISDLITLREGASPGAGFLLVGFAGTAQLQQTNNIGATTDTYGTLAATAAHAGKFTLALAEANTEPRVWKSTGAAGQNIGAFCRVQSAGITDDPTDYTDGSTSGPWDPDTPYQMGDFSSDINSLAEFQRALVGGKPEGLHAADENFNFFNIFSHRSYKSTDNGVNALPYSTFLLLPTVQDLMALPPRGDGSVGLSQLVSNQSQIQGYPTAIATYGKFVYVSFYDSTDSYIVKLVRRSGEQAPHDFLFYGQTKVTAHKIRKMVVTDDNAGTIRLFYATVSDTANKYDVGYMTLDPVSARRYQGGGTLKLTKRGDATRFCTIEALTFYGVDCNATNYWAVQVAWDEAAAGAPVASPANRINTNGRVRILPTPDGGGDQGFQYQVQLTPTISADTNRPRVRGSTVGEAGGDGAIVQGQRQPKGNVDRFEMTIRAAGEGGQMDGQGGTLKESAEELYEALVPLCHAGPVDLIYEAHFHDTSAHKVLINTVGYAELKADGDRLPDRGIRVTGRLMQNTT